MALVTRDEIKIYIKQYLTEHIPFGLVLVVLLYVYPTIVVKNHFSIITSFFTRSLEKDFFILLIILLVFIISSELFLIYFGILLYAFPVCVILVFIGFYESVFILFIGDLLLLFLPILIDRIIFILRIPEVDVKSFIQKKGNQEVKEINEVNNLSYYRNIKDKD